MRTAIAAKLCLGLLLLALLLPVQIYSQNVTTAPSINNTSTSTTILATTKQSQNKTTSTSSTTTTTTAATTATTATTGSGNSLQSTASLFIFSLSVLHLYC